MKESTIQISKSMQDICRRLSDDIDQCAGEHIGFTLVIFTEERATYASNVSREESIREIKHLLELWGEGMPDIPAHEVQ